MWLFEQILEYAFWVFSEKNKSAKQWNGIERGKKGVFKVFFRQQNWFTLLMSLVRI